MVLSFNLLSCVCLSCDPMGCIPVGSSVHGTSQTRILDQVASLVPCTSLSALEGTSFVYSGSWEKLSNS